MARCFEGLTLNKITLRQYQDLYNDQAQDFNQRFEAAEGAAYREASTDSSLKLKVISSSYEIPIQSHNQVAPSVPLSTDGGGTRFNSTRRDLKSHQQMTKCASSQNRRTSLKQKQNFVDEPHDELTMNLENMFNSGFTSVDLLSRQSLHENQLKTNHSRRLEPNLQMQMQRAESKNMTQRKENQRMLFSP